jgi:molecular chaperone GrpE (heat shock protein)
MENEQLQELSKLIEEVVEDNVTLVETLARLRDGQEQMRVDFLREINLLREEFKGAVSFRVLRELCREMAPTIAATEALLAQESLDDPDVLKSHVSSISLTLTSILQRLGADKIPVNLGEEQFDPSRHLCVRLIKPEESPFPNAMPRSIVRIVEDGYMVEDKIIAPVKVDVQAERSPVV